MNGKESNRVDHILPKKELKIDKIYNMMYKTTVSQVNFNGATGTLQMFRSNEKLEFVSLSKTYSYKY